MAMLFEGGTLPTRREAELLVIGAGPAGLAVALSASAAGLDVLVLESGGLEASPDPGTSGAEVAGPPYYDLTAVRVRGLGGSSTTWGGWCERLGALDFFERPWIPHSGWPFQLGELEPYYTRAEEFLGVSPANCDRRWSPGGVPFSQDARFMATSIEVTPEKNLATRYRTALRDGPIRVILDATVTGFVLDGAETAVQAVRVTRSDGTSYHVSAATFVVAAGGIENARMLMAARSRAWGRGLGNETGLVGHFFMEHPHVDAIRFSASRPQQIHETFFVETADEDGGLSASIGALNVTDAACEAYGVGRAQVILERAGLHTLGRPAMRRGDKAWSPRYAEPPAGEMAAIVISEQAPSHRSVVTLSDKVDRFGVPLPRLEWHLSELDFATCAAATDLMTETLHEIGIASTRRRLPRDRFPLDTIGGPHHLGTTRMAVEESSGVLDTNSCVFGIANLYVVGGSAFPTAGYAPPTLTIVALAIRAADHIIKLLRQAGG
jgi:choline dehydrogenase-like flavoprotein